VAYGTREDACVAVCAARASCVMFAFPRLQSCLAALLAVAWFPTLAPQGLGYAGGRLHRRLRRSHPLCTFCRQLCVGMPAVRRL